MSIYAYTGLPGSGKSYSVVEHQVLPALKSGRRVVTNIPLHAEVVKAEFPNAELVDLPTQRVQGDPATIYEYVTPGSVLILDEVWRLFPAGLKANHVPEPFRKLLAEHRHMVDVAGNSCQIVLVTQDLAQISAFARQLVEQTFRTVKLTSVGMSKQFRVDVYNGPATGPNPPENARIRQMFGQYRSDVWKFYKSHTLVAEDGNADKVNERPVDRRANILHRPVMVLGFVAALCFIAYGLYGLSGLMDKMEKPEAAAGADAPGAAPAVNAASVVADPLAPVAAASSSASASPGVAPELADLRIAAVLRVVDDDKRSRVVITDGEKNFTIPYSQWCYDTPDGRTFCRYKGQEVSQFDAARYTVPPEAQERLARDRAYLARQTEAEGRSWEPEGFEVPSGTVHNSDPAPGRALRKSRIAEWRNQ